MSDGHEPIRVLLVDDHRVVRRGVMAYLDLVDDITVVGEAGDGHQALDRIAALSPADDQPDVVLMDLLMPGMDGISATRAIKSRWPVIEVVAMTSFVEEAKVRGGGIQPPDRGHTGRQRAHRAHARIGDSAQAGAGVPHSGRPLGGQAGPVLDVGRQFPVGARRERKRCGLC